MLTGSADAAHHPRDEGDAARDAAGQARAGSKGEEGSRATVADRKDGDRDTNADHAGANSQAYVRGYRV